MGASPQGELRWVMERSQTREEVLVVYPKAVWFAGDSPPIGQRVILRADEEGVRETGVVVGAYVPAVQRRHSLICPTCACEFVPKGMEGWWEVAWDGWWEIKGVDREWFHKWLEAHPGAYGPALSIRSAEKPPGEGVEPMVTIEYPPTLAPPGEQVKV